MKMGSRYLVILILLLIVVTFGVTFSYFGANIIKNGESDTTVTTGKVELSIDEKEVNTHDITPIYDEDYEMIAYKKDFEIISSSTLNACANIYLDINNFVRLKTKIDSIIFVFPSPLFPIIMFLLEEKFKSKFSKFLKFTSFKDVISILNPLLNKYNK